MHPAALRRDLRRTATGRGAWGRESGGRACVGVYTVVQLGSGRPSRVAVRL